MATEKRLDLIDRKDLIKAVEKKQFAIADNTHPYEAIRIQGKYFREVVDNAPTVDAVEVVRCRDCEHWKEPWLEGVTSGKCMLGKTMITETDHFCSYGERKINK